MRTYASFRKLRRRGAGGGCRVVWARLEELVAIAPGRVQFLVLPKNWAARLRVLPGLPHCALHNKARRVSNSTDQRGGPRCPDRGGASQRKPNLKTPRSGEVG